MIAEVCLSQLPDKALVLAFFLKKKNRKDKQVLSFVMTVMSVQKFDFLHVCKVECILRLIYLHKLAGKCPVS